MSAYPPRIVGIAFLLTLGSLGWQTPPEMSATAEFLDALQNPDGGYGGEPGGSSSLGATSSALKSLRNVRGPVSDYSLCRGFVLDCFDEPSGGFAQNPGGQPDVGTTASGLMALGELGLADREEVARAAAYLDANAKTFPEVRIAVAGLEAVGAKPVDPEKWEAIVQEGRNEDGTWGEGDAQAFETGGHAVALLRMGLDLGEVGPVASAILAGQGPNGLWSESGGEPDLSATYRVTRAVYMMRLQPDIEALRGHIASCRNPDGGYGTAPGKPSSLGGVYLATTVDRWARLLGGEPEFVETAGFQPLLDGGLDGWDGDKELWKVEDGRIVGDSNGIDHNEFLVAPGDYGDFLLKLAFQLRDGQGNSGVQFRSVRIPGTEMSGYQADIGDGYWGSLYDESRRNRVLVPGDERALESLDPDGWNQYELRVLGDQIRLNLNGRTSASYQEDDPKIARSGKLALQVHAGGPMRIEFADLLIQPVPTPTADLDENAPGFHLKRLGGKPDGRLYTVYLPEGYDPTTRYPAVLFLHGSGERGDDGVLPAQVGLGPSLARLGGDFPAIAVFPQARETWAADSEDAVEALNALDEVMETYDVDPDRVALTGISMGGFGSWGLAAAYPDRFVAVAPVCGFAREEVVAPIVEAELPVWTFVGDADNERILGSTRSLSAALRDAGAPLHETEYRAVGHNSWDRAYSDPNLLHWLLEPR